jgi:hypothetical protein
MAERHPSSEQSEVSQDVLSAIRKEAVSKIATWAMALALALIVAAVTGWWLFFQPTIARLVGGVPIGAVLAFDTDDCPAGWTYFKQATSRAIVGAAISVRPQEGYFSVEMDSYDTRQLQPIKPRNHIAPAWEPRVLVSTVGPAPSANIMPPYIALVYCKKD